MQEFASTIEYCMFHEADLRRAIYYKKHDRAKQGAGRKTGISKPTENEALWNLSSVGTVLVNDLVVVDNPENMRDAISYTKAHYNTDDKIGRTYRAYFIEHEKDYNVICKKVGISKSTYYNYIGRILAYAERKYLCLSRLQLQ